MRERNSHFGTKTLHYNLGRPIGADLGSNFAKIERPTLLNVESG